MLKKKSTELLNNPKHTLENTSPFIEEENLWQWLECTDEVPVTQSLTIQEMYSVLNQ